MVKERGFDKETVRDVFLLLTEEIGELAKAIRHAEKLHIDETSEKKELKGELADVFIYLLDLSNHLGVDLEECFRKKETMNKTRTWRHGTSV